MLKAVKFGGSSLSDAGQFKKVYDIIKSDEERRYVVPSAPGKRFPEDEKITDLLYACYDKAAAGENFEELFSRITGRYDEIISKLSLSVDLNDEYGTIKESFIEKKGRDYAASRGEYLSGIVLAAYLGFPFIDPAGLILFTENGAFDAERTNVLLGEKLTPLKNAVVPGFYGSYADGRIKTFSRGGSDVTGAVVARAVGAALYENWTDVSGFMAADPRIVKNPRPMDVITYRELRELSYMGATVLHEDAIFPVRREDIPINIKNTNDPSAPGTYIVGNRADYNRRHIITGIAGKRGFSVLTIEKDMMNQELGFGRRVLEVLEANKISFEHLPSGIDTMSVILGDKEIIGKEDAVIRGIKAAVAPDNVELECGLALIAVVGRGMVRAKGTAARVFAAIAKADINIRMIDQGSSELNIIVGVDENDFETTIRTIYSEFVGD